MLILIVDDEKDYCATLKVALQKEHEVLLCHDGEAALQTLEKTSVDLVLTDHQMPKLSGIDLIRKGKEVSPMTAFVLVTAYGSVNQAVEAIRLGAEDYLVKPFELTELRHRVSRIAELRAWKEEAALKGQDAQGVGRLVGASPAIQRAKEFIHKAATAPSPVLLLGASGSGKEVVAKAIHEVGPRAVRPFVAINCASLNEQLIESELFGHEKGAFTGAAAAKPGKFELAKSGTIFLDEIGELSPTLQAKLLRVLQEKEFYRVGGVRQIKTDARVIAATHRSLKEMVKQGTFREDLYFRLNVLTLDLPPLCERREDIPLLIQHLWGKLCLEFGKKPALDPATMNALLHYRYPGNVRELQNVLERLIVLGDGKASIGPEALPSEFHGGSGAVPATGGLPTVDGSTGLDELLEGLEGKILEETMARANHSQAKAAELLKVTRGALQYKLKKHGLVAEAKPKPEKKAA